MSKRPHPRGDPSGEWRKGESGAAAGPNPSSEQAEADALALVGTPQPAPGSDPYNQTDEASPPPSQPLRRRSLDDMRRLSEAIKSAPTWTPPGKPATAALYRRLEALRVELQRSLDEINSLRAGAQGEHHPRTLLVQLRDAAHHLGEAVKSLVTPDS